MRWARIALFVCGAVLFIALLIHIGPAVVMSFFAELSWRLPVILLFPFCLMTILDALGWRFAFSRDRVPFGALLSARLAGEAFNVTTPTASVGGEAVKAWLLRPYLPMTESLPSVIIAKTTMTIGQVLFLLLGLLVAWSTLHTGSSLLRAMQWMLGLECLAAVGFVTVQVLGVMDGAGRILDRLRLFGHHDGARTLREMDQSLAHFYRHQPGRLLLSIGFHFCGWALGVVEAYIILQALGFPVSLATATVIEAFGTGVGFAAFLIPARLGAMEAGDVAVFTLMGLGAPAGLAFSLIRRLRGLVWTGVGFLALWSLRTRPRALPTVALEPEA